MDFFFFLIWLPPISDSSSHDLSAGGVQPSASEMEKAFWSLPQAWCCTVPVPVRADTSRTRIKSDLSSLPVVTQLGDILPLWSGAELILTGAFLGTAARQPVISGHLSSAQ